MTLTYEEQAERDEAYHSQMDLCMAESAAMLYSLGIADACTFKVAKMGDPNYIDGYMYGISLLPKDDYLFQIQRSKYKQVQLPSFVQQLPDEF